MASYVGHLTFASALGVGYGAAGVGLLHLEDWGPLCLGWGLTVIGGLLPDLDSDSSVPVRELFSLLAAVTPILLYEQIRDGHGLTTEQTFVVLGAVYLGVRYGLARLFKSLTVHRGMFHSIPAMLIAGLAVFLANRTGSQTDRLYLAGAATLGYLSHLVLDELYAVNFIGRPVRFNRFAGSALKLASRSLPATVCTYAVLAVLAWLAWNDLTA
jgi:hypothetical protein